MKWMLFCLPLHLVLVRFEPMPSSSSDTILVDAAVFWLVLFPWTSDGLFSSICSSHVVGKAERCDIAQCQYICGSQSLFISSLLMEYIDHLWILASNGGEGQSTSCGNLLLGEGW